MIQGSGRCAAVGNQIGDEQRGLAPVSTSTAWWNGTWPGVSRTEIPGQHLAVAVQQPPAVRGGDRLEVVRQIARPGALVGVAGELELAALHDVGGVGERRAGRGAAGSFSSSGSMRGVAAGMVEVQMGVDDPAHVRAAGTRRRPARPPAGWRPPVPAFSTP